MAMSRRHLGSARTRSVVHTRNRPSRKLPVMLMNRVPKGKLAPIRRAAMRLTRKRRLAPRTAPRDIQR
jgi:hypothetical protein